MDSIEEKLRIEDGHVMGIYINFPFKPNKYEGHDHSDLTKCNLYKLLPSEIRKEVEINLHLLEYLHILPIETIGMPKYISNLESKHGEIAELNLIYKVSDQTYVHIYPNKNDVRNFYIPIEPILLTGVGSLIKELETKLVDHLTGLDFDPENMEEKEKILREFLEAICIISNQKIVDNSSSGFNKLFGAKSLLNGTEVLPFPTIFLILQ